MRFFFRSRQFKIIVAVVTALIALSVLFALIGGSMTPGANIIASITAPFRSVATTVSEFASDFFSAYRDGEKLIQENAELEQEISKMRQELAEYERMKEENENLKNYLEIKDAHPDFKFAPATLIARDPDDPYMGFTINKGTLAGISAYDPVMTEAGLIGYIGEVGLTSAKVTTLFSSELSFGALDNRTSDSGIMQGTIELAAEGKTKFLNLSRSCSVAVGDYVITSGEGIFPNGLLVGSVVSIGNDPYNTSIFAVVEPFVRFESIKEVMVITEFEGQGGLKPGE